MPIHYSTFGNICQSLFQNSQIFQEMPEQQKYGSDAKFSIIGKILSIFGNYFHYIIDISSILW